MAGSELRVPDISDPLAPPEPTWLDALSDRWFSPLLVDQRDVVFTRLITRLATQLLPLTVLMYAIPDLWAAILTVPYVAYLFVRFGGPVVLGLHAVTHRPMMKKRHRQWDKVMTHLVPCFMGMPPFAYHSHHVRMHHKMENREDDLSSTAAYQRDHLGHFLHYWARFALFGYYHMASWLLRGERKREVVTMLVGDLAVYLVMIGLTVWKPAAAVATFWVPFVMLRFFLMAGNWTEHAFIDVEHPDDRYRNSTNLLNTPYNHRCYNAGYHMIHHVVPGLHWADTVPYFLKHHAKFVEHDAVMFDGIRNNQQIWWRLMRRDYGFLADHLLDAADRRPDREERIAFLKSRVKPRIGERKGLLERRERRSA